MYVIISGCQPGVNVLPVVKEMDRSDHAPPMKPFPTRDLARLRRALLAWYEANGRELPWRQARDPYRVWVSEIMLQQTRVGAVLPRYERFLKKFPSVETLAAAKESWVLAEWSGLGYYRRARNLHAAAKTVARKYGGVFPGTAQLWSELPGVGRYTAAAISSIAGGEAVAVLDGNVRRVLGRLAQIRSQAESWRAAELLLDRDRPGDFNQAMMELGALVCLAGQPRCSSCPIQSFCRTCGKGNANRVASARAKREIAYALVRGHDSLRLVRRAKDDRLMPGMWELPQVDGVRTSGTPLFTVRHSITVTDYVVRVVPADDSAAKLGTWVRIARLNSIPLTGLAKKILRRAHIIQ
jgi:A/G-specific adenine glycosylase